MNMTILSGRLTRDAELSHIGVNNTPKLKFSLAVERNYQKSKENKVVDFIDMELLGTRAEALAKYLIKGKSVLCHGELNIDKYKNEKGEVRTATRVKVDRIEFLSSNSGNDNSKIQPVVKDYDVSSIGYEQNLSKGIEATPLDDDDVPF